MKMLPLRKATIASLENIQIPLPIRCLCELSLGFAVSLLKPQPDDYGSFFYKETAVNAHMQRRIGMPCLDYRSAHPLSLPNKISLFFKLRIVSEMSSLRC